MAQHNNSTIALSLGGGSDGAGGTLARQYLIYTFSSDAQSYSASGAPYGVALAGATGNQTDMITLSGFNSTANPPTYAARNTKILRFTMSTAALVSDGGTVGTAFSHNDAAGDDSVGIWAGCQSDLDRTTRENAYTYATNTATLLSAYLANNQLYTTNNWESNTACHSLQIS
jgi:hypothetical protein